MDTVSRLKPLGLKPKPEWRRRSFKNVGDYLIFRGVREKDPILKTQRTYDQIVNIQGSKFQENTELNFASFNNKIDPIDQFRHEIIHPIAWKIAINIFGDDVENYHNQTEFIAGGIDMFISKDETFVTANSRNKIMESYNFIFQMSISQAMEDCLGSKKEEFIQKILDLTNKSEELYMKNDDFCLSYRSIFEYLEYDLEEVDLREGLISKGMILRKIKEIILKIKEKNSFECFDLLNLKKDHLPSIEDFLEIFKYKHEGYNYGYRDVFNSIKEKRIYAPTEILGKYE